MWRIDKTQEIEEWILNLDVDIREAIFARLIVLSEIGPKLGRPYVDSVYGSRHNNMKELRVQNKKNLYRVFFAFVPRRIAILLIGGNKKGVNRFYVDMIKKADELYDVHLKELENDNEKREK